MSIEFKEGAVCFAKGEQWFANEVESLTGESGRDMEIDSPIEFEDFQLNTINKGDYIEASELDTEDKYNRDIEVFGLFGFDVSGDFEWFKDESCRYNLFFIDECKDLDSCVKTYGKLKRKLTFNQLMAIGELKRLMNERDSIKRQSEYCRCTQVEVGNIKAKPSRSVSKVNRDIERNQPKNKSKQAYAILESLGYGYDLVEQKWFRKEWV